MGCVSIPTVPLPQQLPHSPTSINKALPQKHYITQAELQEEIQKVQESYILFSQDLNNLEWWYTSQFFNDIRVLGQQIIDALNNSNSAEEMQYYRQLYYELQDQLNDAAEWWATKRTNILDIRDKWEDGPKQ